MPQVVFLPDLRTKQASEHSKHYNSGYKGDQPNNQLGADLSPFTSQQHVLSLYREL